MVTVTNHGEGCPIRRCDRPLDDHECDGWDANGNPVNPVNPVCPDVHVP